MAPPARSFSTRVSTTAANAKKRVSSALDAIPLPSISNSDTQEKKRSEAFDREAELAAFARLLSSGAGAGAPASTVNSNSANKIDLDNQATSDTSKPLADQPLLGNDNISRPFGTIELQTTTCEGPKKTQNKMSNQANSDRSQSQAPTEEDLSWQNITVTRETTVVSEPRDFASLPQNEFSATCTHKPEPADREGNFKCKCGAVYGSTTVYTGPMRSSDVPDPTQSRTYTTTEYVFTLLSSSRVSPGALLQTTPSIDFFNTRLKHFHTIRSLVSALCHSNTRKIY